MSQALNLNTILAQAGVKTDEATGALTTPCIFQRPTSTQSLVNQLVMTTLGPRIQHVLALRRLWLLSKVLIML